MSSRAASVRAAGIVSATVTSIDGSRKKSFRLQSPLDSTLWVTQQAWNTAAPKNSRQWLSATKRAIDLALASLALVLTVPFMCAIALAIALDSSGPVFYRTYRVGKRGCLFRLYKFRTMVSNAEDLLDEVWALNQRKGVLFKANPDPRVTRIGRFLRRYSLDELPQLWNIIRGDMSLVGPRPALVAEYEQFAGDVCRRMIVPPGLSGLWQVTARSDPSFENYVRLDCDYVDHWSLWLDIKILLRTIPAVLRGSGE